MASRFSGSAIDCADPLLPAASSCAALDIAVIGDGVLAACRRDGYGATGRPGAKAGMRCSTPKATSLLRQRTS